VDVRRCGESIPERGIVVGEASDAGDLDWWAARIGGERLAAGAAGFFAAMLAVRGKGGSPPREEYGYPARSGRVNPARGEGDDPVRGDKADVPAFGAPVLFVTGTTFADNRELARRAHRSGAPVSFIGGAKWVGEASALLRDGGKAIVAVDGEHQPAGAARIRADMAEGVCRVLQQSPVRELVIEGGATAYAIIRRIGMDRLYPLEELAPGVVRMRAGDFFITVKPGSYRWPETIKYLS
ncbi:MAG TPA: nucleotide-binding domain containing protein, partial [Puia sp.]|nr:nucleotide-binding domain containing protein [Puia sp.]